MADQSQTAAVSQVSEIITSAVGIASVSAVPEIITSAVGLGSVSAISEIITSAVGLGSTAVVVEIGRESVVPVISNVTGAINTTVTFDGSANTADSFDWSWVSVPVGSAIANLPLDLPDNAVGSLMANNGALFHFNNNTTDTSGNSNGLTTSGTSFASGYDGAVNGSLKFDGTTSTALLANPVSLSGDWTVAFWFYNLLPNTTWRTGLRGSNVDHQIIVESGSDRLGVYASGTGAFRPSGFDMPSGTYQGWHHIVAVGSGSTTAFYVNGVNVGSSDRKSTDNVYSIGNYQLASSGGAQQQFAERIDEFAAWSRALSASEVTEIYNRQTRTGFGYVGSVPYPDNAATTPIDMTDNEGLYHFDGNANDTSGNSRNGNVVGATQVTGYLGTYAYQFNGTASQYVTLGGTTDYHYTTEPFTIACWVRPDATQTKNWCNIFSTLGGGGTWGPQIRGYALGQVSNNNNSYRVLVRTGTTHTETSQFIIPGGTWTHFALVRSGSNWKVYLNGAQQLSETLTATIAQSGNNSALVLGRAGLDYNVNEAWKGAIDEFAIWSRALSAAEISNIYAKQTGGKTSTASFTPDVDGTYEATFSMTVDGFSGSTTVKAFIGDSGLPSRALGGDMVGPSTLAFGALRPGALLPGGK